MEVRPQAPPQPSVGPGRLLTLSLLLTGLTVVLTLVFLSADAVSPSEWAILLAQLSAAVATAAGMGSFGIWAWNLAKMRPELRTPLLIVGAITVGVFLAHLYIVNSPASSVTASLPPALVGSNFSDAHLAVTSSLQGSMLVVHLTNNGGNAISGIALSLDNVTLPSSALSPNPAPDFPLQPGSSGGLGYPIDTQGTWTVSATNTSTLKVSYDYLNCYHVPGPSDNRGVFGCVMDETYYVPSAMGILSGAKCAPYADSCNMEHPPLAKGLIAAGIAVFGVNDFGWRISNIILGTLSIPLLFILAFSLTSNRKLAYAATLLFASDIMFFVHSSTALVDVAAVLFSLAGFVMYFRPSKVWKFDNYTVSGMFLGLAALSKETAVFAIATIVTYELIYGESGLRASAFRLVSVVAPALLLFAGGLQLYDSLLTHTNTYSTCLGNASYDGTFLSQIQFMLSYGGCLRGGGWTDAILGRSITPIDWLLYYSPVQYLVTTVSVTVSGAVTTTYHYVSVGYYGTTNQLVVWEVFIWVPLVAYRLLRVRRWGATPGQDDKFGGFLLIWFLWSYVPYLALFLYGRVTYPFYILPAVPALASGSAYFITRDWFPKKMAMVYIAAAFVIFFLYFPVKDFLPEWLRVILGH